jgi:MraZ protein
MLRGSYTATVDSKGRLKIPAAFKSVLDESYSVEFYVTSLNGDFVRIYPFSVWREIEDKLASLPSFDKAKKKFLNRTNYFGQMVRMDAQSRILIPALLRQTAHMRGEVAVLGGLTYLDVWSRERFQDEIDQNPITPEDEETLSNLGI